MLPFTSLLFAAFFTHSVVAVALDKISIEQDLLRFSYELETWLDVSKKPCDDFFAYVCSRSLNATNEAKYARLLKQEELKFNTFLGNSNDELLLDSELKLKQFYESCRNARSMEQLKATLMYRSVGGWPAIDDSVAMLRKRHNMTWLQVLSVFHETGISYFFQTKIELISNKRVVQMQPNDILRFTLRKFEQLSGEIMQLFSVEAGRARLVTLEILNFERNSRDIMDIAVSEGDKVREYSYADFKLLNFGSVNPLDWDAYFRKVMGKALKPTDLIIVSDMPKLVQYFELLQSTTLRRFLNWLWIDYLMGPQNPFFRNVFSRDNSYFISSILMGFYTQLFVDYRNKNVAEYPAVYQYVVERTGINKVQVAHLYSVLAQQYEQLLAKSSWIDEITQQNSKQFVERIMHLTLNGDTELDSDYHSLTITKRNFYRNLEKVQRFKAQQRKTDNGAKKTSTNSAAHVTQSAKEFMKIFSSIIGLMPQSQNLTTPLDHLMLGEYFSEVMIGGAYEIPGAWRSTDSDKQFDLFDKCLQTQTTVSYKDFNLNNLLLKLLAHQQAWQAYQLWLKQDSEFIENLNNLLLAGRLNLTMEKLYFVATNLVDCLLYPTEQRRSFVHTFLKQSKAFQKTFNCQITDNLFNNNTCSILKENEFKK